ncbi:hypothetical protein F4677DRAFT_414183 [Hypoxylon crocopeplum]|nr:hypothetical protein F4677DRAFT_414183 [Hypoxylon crocopeplum]
MQEDLPFVIPADASPLASNPDAPRRKSRSRTTTACNACRARRTKCDSQRPACGYCRNRGLGCYYEQSQTSSASRVEAELAAINRRLDYIASFLPQTHQSSLDADDEVLSDHSRDSHAVTGKERSPFQLLMTDCIMAVLGLGLGFARELVRLERNAPRVGIGNVPRLRFIQQQKALEALDAFSTRVHIWYPVLRPGFTERYISVISGPLAPGPESCLVLSVAAVGAIAQQDRGLGASCSDNSNELYLEAAMTSLPAVLVDNSIESIQSLVLLSIYHCCLSKPCQAYDYAVIASLKVQNLLKCADESTGELYEQAKRCYWTVLLLESELRDQLDMVDSGIWDHDDKIALPDSRRTWQFDPDAGSLRSGTATSPGSNVSADSVTADKAQAYFLAEIAMRRMLHRCYTAIRRTPLGDIVYAPGIALELELQLDEWHGYLPDTVHFQHLDSSLLSTSQSLTSLESLSNFLRVQYYCCKISIYWPAIYQCIKDGTATAEVLKHCERFFHAYIQSIPSMLMSVRDCIVNRWTLYATIFMTSMAVIQAAGTPCLRHGCAVDWSQLLACLRSTRSVDKRIVQASPSLSLLHNTLAERLAQACSSLGGTDGSG